MNKIELQKVLELHKNGWMMLTAENGQTSKMQTSKMQTYAGQTYAGQTYAGQTYAGQI